MAAASEPPPPHHAATALSPLEDLLQCSICFDDLQDPRILPCHHSFCLQCLQGMQAQHGKAFRCPMCNRHVKVRRSVRELPRDFRTNQLLECHGSLVSAGVYGGTPGADDLTSPSQTAQPHQDSFYMPATSQLSQCYGSLISAGVYGGTPGADDLTSPSPTAQPHQDYSFMLTTSQLPPVPIPVHLVPQSSVEYIVERDYLSGFAVGVGLCVLVAALSFMCSRGVEPPEEPAMGVTSTRLGIFLAGLASNPH